jgi:hypothetical protein
VTGGDSQTVSTYTTWYSTHMPSVFQVKQPVKVMLLDNPQMDSFLRTGGNPDMDFSKPDDSDNSDMSDVDGVFENDPPKIVLRLPPHVEPDMFTFAHEYGHYVWFDLFSKDDRKRYESIYHKQKAAGHLATRYAATDLEEGFAEAFSFYISQPTLLMKRDGASYGFLKTWVDAHAKPAQKLAQ